MDMDMDQEAENIVGVNQHKRRRKKSSVWEHFTIETISASCIRACCKQCKKSFSYISGTKVAGTSHLKRHIVLGICPESHHHQQDQQQQEHQQQTEEESQLALYLPGSETNICPAIEPSRKRYKAIPRLSRIHFNQDLCNLELAKMIILQEYPLHIVEHHEFINFIRTIQPLFDPVTVDFIQEEILSFFLREKQNRIDVLAQSPGRVNLTLDLLLSDNSIGYVLITGYFVDANFKLQRQVLNVIMVPNPDSECSLNQAVLDCLVDWNLEDKLFTVTLAESFASTSFRENLKSLPSVKIQHILNGQLLIGNCYASNLTRLAQDALLLTNEVVGKVRRIVKYVKTSRATEIEFNEMKEHLHVGSTKSLNMDDITKWNTTYHMLKTACELKGVFFCLDTFDSNYELPSNDEWNQVETLCTYLKLMFDASCILVGGTNLTASVFFHEMWKLKYDLINASLSKDVFVSNLTKPLQEKFDHYWRDTCLVMALAVVMDPRFKMKLVEFSFYKIYGEDAEMWIKTVDDGIHELFLEYVVKSLPPANFLMEVNDGSVMTELTKDGNLFSDDGEEFSDFDLYISEITSNQQIKTELHQYLEEPVLPRVQEFDVLVWWELNRANYPTLSQMAFDVLSIPFSTVGTDSVFDTMTKKMDVYRSSLTPQLIQALICSKDWLSRSS
ncbi:zinc finger BED domain-containing protein DAYSLEEPER-like [Impatiens glandulifera]|uniref:zinc finger BED domain-containing protein DAYSLEEPER-like n=1 Tax=Impatiens glandulifera TaxID=253017 RepID=UPI001FB095E1|nr:zinc finger BED domain-containing protein DAYSLEEPER-like [Impatiens glandulifera]XP_047314684.1 zinc finger BED domain-containing protein DAYSLEEPER-like [Impatiens glandulifera]